MSSSLRLRLEGLVVRLISLLSPRAMVRLSGKPAVRVDGQTLAPDVQLLLAGMERRGEPELQHLPLEEGRELRRLGAVLAAGVPAQIGAIRNLQVDGAHGPLPARHYAPPADAPDGAGTPAPLLVFFHGGGFVIGDLDTHDGLCRMLCRHAGVHVLAVDYRLAPEHPFPAAYDDALAAFRWAAEHAAELGADPSRLAVGGDSAGANLSAGVSQALRDEVGERLALQLLLYPPTDLSVKRASMSLFGEGFFLTDAEMTWFRESYMRDAAPEDPRFSVLLGERLDGLAPAIVVTAGFDPLRDEGEDYARALRDAGNDVVLRRFPGLIHGFASMTGVSRSSRDAVLEVCGMARAQLARARVPALEAG